MTSSSIILLPVAALLLLNFILFTDAESVGVCYGRKSDNPLPTEKDVVNLYIKNGITRMRIYDPHPATLQALGGTNIELILGVLHESLMSLTDPNEATKWVQNNILKYRNVNFRYIAVGNEIDQNKESGQFAKFVLPAMRNIQKALTNAGLADKIKVSTATYTGLLKDSSPPSDGAFHDNVREFIEPIIKFLVENKSPMLANIYPYFAYIGDMTNVPLSFALFKEPNGEYSNLFDAMLDAHYAAQSRLGGESLKIVVSESGWPSNGGDGVTATLENAETYYRNLIAHVKQATGTPAKPRNSIETYLFAMFNENQKDGDETEKHFGIFNRDQTPKYRLSF